MRVLANISSVYRSSSIQGFLKAVHISLGAGKGQEHHLFYSTDDKRSTKFVLQGVYYCTSPWLLPHL
jgi:hypothetical protein